MSVDALQLSSSQRTPIVLGASPGNFKAISERSAIKERLGQQLHSRRRVMTNLKYKTRHLGSSEMNSSKFLFLLTSLSRRRQTRVGSNTTPKTPRSSAEALDRCDAPSVPGHFLLDSAQSIPSLHITSACCMYARMHAAHHHHHRHHSVCSIPVNTHSFHLHCSY